MGRKIISIVISVLVIILLVAFNINALITGPVNINARKDRLILNQMLDNNQLTFGTILSRYSYDNVYYTALVTIKNVETIVWYDVDGNIIHQESYSSYHPDMILQKASQEYQLNNPTVILGYFKKQAIYVVNDDQYELRYDYKTNELISVYKKGLKA